MGTISLHNMEFFAHHGCFEEEQLIGTFFSIDIDIETDLSKAAQSDNLDDTLNYQTVYNVVEREMKIPSKLLEHVAQRILYALREESNNIESTVITIRKINPALGGKVGYSAVTMKL